MARLLDASEKRSCLLYAEHLIGRGSQCALRLSEGYVSAQHALIRWQGDRWELLDRGSRNGTELNGTRLIPGQAHALTQGAVITFGHANERWTLADASPPVACVTALDSGETMSGPLGVIGVPSEDNAICTLYLDAEGNWKLESPEQEPRCMADGDTFESGGRAFRFSCPTISSATAALPSAERLDSELHFFVSSDEEFVELRIHNARGRLDLGARSHNYLLLLLARCHLADAANGVTPANCGWMDKEELAEALKLAPEQIDGEVLRIRKHFAHRGAPESGSIIERRPRTRLLRIGIPRLHVHGT
jgi:hypothetical protein